MRASQHGPCPPRQCFCLSPALTAVSVYTNGTVFATDVHITFLAVTEEMTPLEFVWLFGEGPPVKTMSRSIKKRLGVPQW